MAATPVQSLRRLWRNLPLTVKACVLAGAPIAVLLGGFASFSPRPISALVLGLLASTASMIFFARTLRRRIEALQLDARALKMGSPLVSARERSFDELGELRSELERTSEILAKRAQAVREREAQMQMILDNTTAVIYLKDLESRFLLVNQAYKNSFGLTSEQAIGHSPIELFGKKVGEQIRANDLAVLRSKRATQFEESITVNGRHFTYLSVKSPLYDSDGKIYGLCGVSTDVTARESATLSERQSAPVVAIPSVTQKTGPPTHRRDVVGGNRLSLGKGESVLLVEDDVDVCEFEALLLRTLGYHVLLAKDAVEAKAMFRRNKVDLMVTDLYLPGESGLDLITKFNGQNSKTKFVLTSGAEANDFSTERVTFLRKPFEIKELADTVRSVLDQPSAM